VKWPPAWELSVIGSELSSARECVKIELERVELKNFHCWKSSGNGW
jgi:hypothetical protein